METNLLRSAKEVACEGYRLMIDEPCVRRSWKGVDEEKFSTVLLCKKKKGEGEMRTNLEKIIEC